jgi:hypothetical protein
MSAARVVLTRVRRTIVVTFQGAADASTLATASESLMAELGRRDADSVVFEISGCEIIDLDEFAALRKLVLTVQWLGVRGVIAGLRPGIVSYLVSGGVQAGDLQVALNLEQALFETKGSNTDEPNDARPI